MNVHTQRFTAIASVANSRRGRVRRLRRSCRPSDDDDDDDDATLGEELLEVVEEGAALSAVVIGIYMLAGGSIVGLGLIIRRAVVSRSCRPIMRKGKHAKTEDDESI